MQRIHLAFYCLSRCSSTNFALLSLLALTCLPIKSSSRSFQQTSSINPHTVKIQRFKANHWEAKKVNTEFGCTKEEGNGLREDNHDVLYVLLLVVCTTEPLLCLSCLQLRHAIKEKTLLFSENSAVSNPEINRDLELWCLWHTWSCPLASRVARCYTYIMFPVGQQHKSGTQNHTHTQGLKIVIINPLTCRLSPHIWRTVLHSLCSTLLQSPFPISGKNKFCHSHFVSVSPSPSSLCRTFQLFCLYTSFALFLYYFCCFLGQ